MNFLFFSLFPIVSLYLRSLITFKGTKHFEKGPPMR